MGDEGNEHVLSNGKSGTYVDGLCAFNLAGKEEYLTSGIYLTDAGSKIGSFQSQISVEL